MLDPTIMKQSRAHTRGSTLQNGIRQDAGGSEMASATTVFSLGKIDMTRRSLYYNTTLTSPYVPHSHRPGRSFAHQHIDNKCRRTLSTRRRWTLLVSLWKCARAPQRRNRSREETRTFRTTIRKAGDIDLQETCPQLNHWKHLIELV